MSRITPREVRDAALWLDGHGTIPSDRFAPYGLDVISLMMAVAMIDRARAEGWQG